MLAELPENLLKREEGYHPHFHLIFGIWMWWVELQQPSLIIKIQIEQNTGGSLRTLSTWCPVSPVLAPKLLFTCKRNKSLLLKLSILSPAAGLIPNQYKRYSIWSTHPKRCSIQTGFLLRITACHIFPGNSPFILTQ